ncbi:hypothetical protein FRY98_24380 [Paenibacillus faecis]|uniref:Uncharacterized protein n=1 Tax=Paenibacillus faecis TaxID=862114 RepID=A0A5D0CMW5_9BACL|nr:hypothetical protein [Paenibacillus faecis]TYA10910.1 hypothetical protein FRY98_24380 [Paenibacillus faecis]
MGMVTMKEEMNAGDLRVQIDYEAIEKKSSKEFVGRLKKMFGPYGSWECTFFLEEDTPSHYCLYLANGFYLEMHDKTAHDEVIYAQYSKKDGVISINSMNTIFLKRFAPIGVSVNE